MWGGEEGGSEGGGRGYVVPPTSFFPLPFLLSFLFSYSLCPFLSLLSTPMEQLLYPPLTLQVDIASSRAMLHTSHWDAKELVRR